MKLVVIGLLVLNAGLLLGFFLRDATVSRAVQPVAAISTEVGTTEREEPNRAVEAGLEVARGISITPDMRTRADPAHLRGRRMRRPRRAAIRPRRPALRAGGSAGGKPVGGAAAFKPKDLATKLKVTGIDLYSAGDLADRDGRERLVQLRPAELLAVK